MDNIKRNRNKNKIKYGEFIVPALVVIFIFVFMVQAVNINRPEENLRLVWPVVGLLSFLIIMTVIDEVKKMKVDGNAQEFVKTEESKVDTEKMINIKKNQRNLMIRQILVVIFVGIYILTITRVGFLLNSIIFIPVTFWIAGYRNIKISILVTIIVPFFIYVIFRGVFNVLLPASYLDELVLRHIIIPIFY